MKTKVLIIVFLFFITHLLVAQNIVRYDLYVRDTIVNYSGKEKRAVNDIVVQKDTEEGSNSSEK